MPPTSDLRSWVSAAAGGDPRAVGRLISVVEDGSPRVRELMALLVEAGGRAVAPEEAARRDVHVVGLTGAPGVGKSTSVAGLIAAFRAQGRRVGVLAVDPSSPFSGGALLGDRIRMQDHATDREVYIRSMASRGHLGGLAAAAPQAVRVLALAGCDPVLVETVGVGQSEVEVAGAADTTVVLLAPGMGDGIQAAKAGILEVGDVFVVNKADREGAALTMRELRHMISLGRAERGPGSWTPPVISTVASRGEGLTDLVGKLAEHREWLATSGEGQRRRQARARREIEGIAMGALLARINLGSGSLVEQLSRDVAADELDPFAAADELLASVAS